jgi:hypothetical protein
MSTPARTLVAVALLVGALAPPVAQACDEAEKLRLTEEQKKLASRNAWTGVERAYNSLLKTKCDLEFDQYLLGAEAARYLGKTWEQYERLTAAKEFDPQPEIVESLQAIDAAYGRLDITGDPRRRPQLVRPEMPFAPDQRKSIEWAQTVVSETGSFYGMLPQGAYTVGDLEFTVEPGSDWQEITVGKVKKADVASTDGGTTGTTTESFIRYVNVVGTVGPGFLMLPDTDNLGTLGDGNPQFSPSSVFLSGLGFQVGGEIGLTYDEPALGIAATLGWQGGFGTDTLHYVSLWAAGVARPGDLRIALGPQYGIIGGTGTGVDDTFDIGHDLQADPNDQLGWGGLTWGGGVQGSVGYGLLDFDTLQGVVELGGSWQTDFLRSYFGIGLRVGIVPTVPRFKG